MEFAEQLLLQQLGMLESTNDWLGGEALMPDKDKPVLNMRACR